MLFNKHYFFHHLYWQDSPLAQAQDLKDQGNKCFKQGKYDEAIKLYSQAIDVCPPENKMELSTFYANRAAAYEKLVRPVSRLHKKYMIRNKFTS